MTTARAIRVLVKVEGIVQGVGFRPFVFNLAVSLGLRGHVFNHVNGVDIEVEGFADTIENFKHRLEKTAPPLAHITRISAEEIPAINDTDFTIRKSESSGNKSALIAPDSDVCDDCVREMFDPADRRHRYPFINCTNCGPRFTIVCSVPYDRPNTTMDFFNMCGDCKSEYDNPSDRRFHAQPVACPACGPELSLLNEIFYQVDSYDPLTETAKLLADGKIVAVKGIGGYHLAVDAQNETAVKRLRERKMRDEKPFAVMFRNVNEMRKFANVNEHEESFINSRQHPITLVEKIGPDTLPGVAPRNKYLGVMTPYTPLHHLLMAEGAFGALVMTSANISDDPIVYTEDQARELLRGIADAILTHNRSIHSRADDSIERPMNHGPVILRRSRGYTPVPIQLDREYPTVLGVGGELKNTFCFIKGSRAFLSQHIGDLKYENVYTSFTEAVERFKELLDIDKVEAIGYDLHPEYLSTRYAKEQTDAEIVGVQHHHAHLASLMAERNLTGNVIGVIFDGTGYGEDDAIWGGEFLTGGYGGYERAATIHPLHLPGGEKAIKEPFRIALGLLFDIYGDDIPALPVEWLKEMDNSKLILYRQMIERGVNTPLSHGMGRLFDAASALRGLRPVISFEGQAAMELEMAIKNESDESYPVEITTHDGIPAIDFRPAMKAYVEDIIASAPIPALAVKFHNTVAKAALTMVREIHRASGLDRVLLSGGVFQNRYLSDRLGAALERDGFKVVRHSRTPPNDGGISLGQAIIAANRIMR